MKAHDFQSMLFQHTLKTFCNTVRTNEFERANLLERQREGIALAKASGRFKGRKEICVPDFEEHYARYMAREISKVQLAKKLNISRPTLDRLIKQNKKIENCCPAVFFFIFNTKVPVESYVENIGIIVYNIISGKICF